VERCQTLIQSQFNIQSCAALPCIAKLKWITQYQSCRQWISLALSPKTLAVW
jgi:hypothetical protein